MIGRRLPQIAFAVLALATIGAFFLIQRLKTKPPLLYPSLRSVPAAINPVSGRTCISSKGVPIDYRETKLTLAISHPDSVGVYIVNAEDANGPTVATISAGTQMKGSLNQAVATKFSRVFTWDGSLSDGTLATAGTYYFRVVLSGQDRSINLSQWPVQVITQPPHPRILSVRVVSSRGTTRTGTATTTAAGGTGTTTTPAGGTGTTSTTATTSTAVASPAVLSPTRGAVTSEARISFSGGPYRRAWIEIYRTDVAGPPQRVSELAVHNPLKQKSYLWNGKIKGRPAPAGTYLVGIRAQDVACNKASWPVTLPPAPGTTPHAGVTIRYLTVTPPLTPTVSGGRASVAVSSPSGRYIWRLRRAGNHRLIAHGSGPSGGSTIHVRMPRRKAGLYTLTVRSGTQSAVVPLVGSRAGAAAAHAPVLVVLPMLSWMGDTPVDSSGDGLPDTLKKGDAVSLNRPLVNGPPASLGADAALLNYLDSLHLAYQLTTDIALAERRGPSLVHRSGVLFPDGTNFLPAGLRQPLTAFVRAGGRALTLGTGTFRGVSHITGFPAAPRAGTPLTSAVDAFGVRRGPITPTNGELITDLTDALNMFAGGSIAFSGFSQYQPLEPPKSTAISAAGIANGTPAIIAFDYGSGTVIEVGLPSFGASLAHNVDSQELLGNAWQVLSKQR